MKLYKVTYEFSDSNWNIYIVAESPLLAIVKFNDYVQKEKNSKHHQFQSIELISNQVII